MCFAILLFFLFSLSVFILLGIFSDLGLCKLMFCTYLGNFGPLFPILFSLFPSVIPNKSVLPLDVSHQVLELLHFSSFFFPFLLQTKDLCSRSVTLLAVSFLLLSPLSEFFISGLEF